MKIAIFVAAAVLFSCNSGAYKQKNTAQQPDNSNQKKQINITAIPSKQAPLKIGDIVNFNPKTEIPNLPDSVKLTVASKTYKTFYSTDLLVWNTANENPGNKKLLFTFYWADSISATATVNTELYSDKTPEKYGYTIKNKWAHNTNAYTQGLEFNNGFLYEGTGLNEKSMLFKFDLEKNEIIQSVNLPGDVFGEGITIMGDKIYQITWRSNTGYVYNKESLTKLYSFTYPTEGWGLTNNDTELIMSDGTNSIYYLDTEFIQETRSIQVYDDKGPVKSLNELEFVDGLIYANIYGSDVIVAFEAETGKVLKHINMQGLLDKVKVTNSIDVLNGIAYDRPNNRFVVTGKFWPYYFEVVWKKK